MPSVFSKGMALILGWRFDPIDHLGHRQRFADSRRCALCSPSRGPPLLTEQPFHVSPPVQDANDLERLVSGRSITKYLNTDQNRTSASVRSVRT